MKRMTKEEARELFLNGETIYLDNGYARTYKGTIPMNWLNEFIKQYGKLTYSREIYGKYGVIIFAETRFIKKDVDEE